MGLNSVGFEASRRLMRLWTFSSLWTQEMTRNSEVRGVVWIVFKRLYFLDESSGISGF